MLNWFNILLEWETPLHQEVLSLEEEKEKGKKEKKNKERNEKKKPNMDFWVQNEMVNKQQAQLQN